MIDDKLTHDERLKLECIAQAIAMRAPYVSACPTAADITAIASELEEHVRSEPKVEYVSIGWLDPETGMLRGSHEAGTRSDIHVYRKKESDS